MKKLGGDKNIFFELDDNNDDTTRQREKMKEKEGKKMMI